MQYYGTRLSDNMSRRDPEGYLFCLNVPVARTGWQDYLPEELGLPRSRAGPAGCVSVYRPEEEVFSPAAIASFEAMPVTNDHPAEGVTVENARFLSKGHVHNVRRGAGEESDLLLADLVIQDPALIKAILDGGKREISCGYMYELSEEDGALIQRKIRGNHIAVVDAGRAGHRVAIRDSTCNAGTVPPLHPSLTTLSTDERRHFPMTKSLYKKLVRMARDGDAEAIEAVAEIVENLTEAEASDPVAVAVAEPAPAAAPEAEPAAVAVAASEEPEQLLDSGGDLGAAILAKLDQLIALLTPAAADEVPTDPESDPVAEEIAEAVAEAVEAGAAAEEAADPVAAEVAEIVEEILQEEPSTVLEADCDDPDCSSDALRAAITTVRPMLAKLPKDQRRKVSGDIAAKLRKGKAGPGVYAALAAARAHDRTAEEDPKSLGRQIMSRRNPHYKE